MCWGKVRELSKMTQRLQQWGEGERVELLKAAGVRELGSIIRMSGLVLLSLGKLVCIQKLTSRRHFKRVE